MDAEENTWFVSVEREAYWLARIRTMKWPRRNDSRTEPPLERACVRLFDAIPRLVRVGD